MVTCLMICLDLAAPDMIKFGIESKLSSPLTSTGKLKQAIMESLYEMRDVCLSLEVVSGFNLTPHL